MQAVPVIALVDPDTLEALRPSLDAITEQITLSDTQKMAGWTPEALALGVVLRQFAESFEVVPS